MSARRLAGKIALITGAAGGIGAEVARKFREEGAEVFVCDTNSAEGEKTAASIGAVFIPLDVTSEESWVAAYAVVMERAKRLDILVNNAGINIRKNIEEMPVESFDAMIGVNVRGPFLGMKHALPIMRAGGGGVILNMGSTSGMNGYPRYADYDAAKAGVIELTRTMALELAPTIRVACVCPGYVWTPMQEAEYTPEMKAAVDAKIPLRRHARPEEIAALYAFLASDEAPYITGHPVIIDGGEIAGGLASR